MTTEREKPPSHGLDREELVKRVGGGHAGGLNIALRLTDQSLRRMLDQGITGQTLWARATGNGATDVIAMLDDRPKAPDA